MDVSPLLPVAESILGGWRPRIGDPTIAGWATVVAYFASALACASAARSERRPGLAGSPATGGAIPGRLALFWVVLAVGLAMLGVNKQLDLQSLVSIIGRRVAQEQGWYESRREVQRMFIIGVAAVGVGLMLAFALVFRSVMLRRPLAVIGMGFLLVFILIRAASFHRVDMMLGQRLLGLRYNTLLEVGGIVCVAASAGRRLLEHRTRRG